MSRTYRNDRARHDAATRRAERVNRRNVKHADTLLQLTRGTAETGTVTL